MTSRRARGLRLVPSARRRRAGLSLAGMTVVAGGLLLGTSQPVAATRPAVGPVAGDLPVCITPVPVPVVPPVCIPPATSPVVPPALSSLPGTSNLLPGASSSARPGTSGTAGTRPGAKRVTTPSSAPVLRTGRLRLPTIARLPASAPFGPGVAVKAKAILDLGAPPAVAPLEPLAGLNFASSPVFWPLLVVLDVLGLLGVVLLARRAWSRREPA